MKFKRIEQKDSKQRIKEMRSDLRELDEEIDRLNDILDADSPTEEVLNEAFNGREEDAREIPVIDLFYPAQYDPSVPDQFLVFEFDGNLMALDGRTIRFELRENDNRSIYSLPFHGIYNPGNMSDNEPSEDEEVHQNTRNINHSEIGENSDLDESGEPSSKRNKRQ